MKTYRVCLEHSDNGQEVAYKFAHMLSELGEEFGFVVSVDDDGDGIICMVSPD